MHVEKTLPFFFNYIVSGPNQGSPILEHSQDCIPLETLELTSLNICNVSESTVDVRSRYSGSSRLRGCLGAATKCRVQVCDCFSIGCGIPNSHFLLFLENFEKKCSCNFFLQIMKWSRCGPDDKGRWLYNWIHRFFGCGAFLMAGVFKFSFCFFHIKFG